MKEEVKIIANNGKVYKDFRSFHIALGHAVRQVLLDFAEEIEEMCQQRVNEFYAEYSPEYYNRSYQLMDKMKLGELIKIKVVGNFQAKYVLEYQLFDSDVLDSFRSEKYGFGTYMSFDGTSSTDEIETYLMNGIYGHPSLDLYAEIDKYVNEHLDNRVQKVINEF